MCIAIYDALQHSMEFNKVEKALEIRLKMLYTFEVFLVDR